MEILKPNQLVSLAIHLFSEPMATPHTHTHTLDDWFAPSVLPVRKEEEWEKVFCGCPDCWETRKYFLDDDANNHWNRWSCRKIAAYEAQLEAKAKKRFSPEVSMAGFKPASKAQLDTWKAWLSTPEIANAYDKIVEETEAAKAAYETTKFDPIAMERWIESRWPNERTNIERSPMWVAYNNYGKEQHALLKAYNKVLTNGIKTRRDYENADRLYKELTTHIDKHGRIITDALEKKHKLPAEKAAEIQKKGRRAMRAERNASNSSSSTVSRQEMRASRVVSVQPYMATGDNDE
jgi:hypothetical protein